MFSTLNKTERRIFGAALLCFIFFLFVLTNESFFDWDSKNLGLKTIGTIIQTRADARQKFAKKFLWKTAKKDADVHLGDSVFTGANSEIKIKLNDGSEILIKENSLVVFNMSGNEMNMSFSFGNLTVLSGEVKVNGAAIANSRPQVIEKGKPKPVEVRKVVKAPVRALEAPRFVSPKQNYVKVNEKGEDGRWKTSRQLALQWAHVRKSATFELQFTRDASFKDGLKPMKVKGLSTVSPALPAGDYQVRAREIDNDPRLGSVWSPVLSFTVQDREYNTGLEAPKLVNPLLTYRAPTKDIPRFKWTRVPKASQYIFELSAKKDFKDARSTRVLTTEFPWQKFATGKYYFRVAAGTAKGTRGPSSEIGLVDIKIGKPVLSPVEKKVVMGKTPEDMGDPQDFKVNWTGLQTAEKYQVQLSKDGSFKAPIQIESRSPASVLTVPEPGAYKWRVRPLASTGKPLAPYSEPGLIEYQLKVPLSTPKLLEPVQNMTLFFQKNDSRLFWMEWKSVRQADSYTLQVAKSADFKELVFEKKIKKTRYLVQGKLPQGKLYWRVKAENESRASYWSETRRMKVFAGKTAELFQRESE